MNKSPDIFKGKEQEFKTRFEKDGYNWEEVKSKLESVERDEQIDRRLTELEGKTEDYYNYLKGLIDKQISENSSEKPKEKEDDKEQDNKESFLSNAKEKAKQKVIEEAEKKGGFYGKIAKFFLEGTEEKETDGFGTKIWNGMKIGIGMAILGWFGIKGLETTGVIENAKDKISSTVSDVKTTVDSAKSTLTDTTNSVSSTISTVTDTVDSTFQKANETVENGKDLVNSGTEKVGEVFKNKYSSTGLLILKTFSIDKFEAQDTTDLFSKFQNQKFSDLQEKFSLMDNSGEMNETEVQKFRNEIEGLEGYSTKDIYNMLKIFFATETTNIIFRERLLPQNIENILNSVDRQKLDKILGEGKVNEIVSKNYDFNKLDLKTIMTLLGLSYKGFIGSSILQGFEAGKNFFNDLFFGQNGINIFNELKSDLEERKNNLLPASVYGILRGDSGTKIGGSQKVDIKLEGLLSQEDLEKLNKEDLEKLKKFLAFRDTVLNEFRDPNSKFALGLTDFRENFDKAINLNEIIYLYLVFDGDTSFLNGNDSMAKAGVCVWLYKLFDGNKQTSNFAGKYVAKIENELRDGATYFTEDEKIFINILIYKITGSLLRPYIETVKKVEGFVNQEISVALIGMGVSSEYANELAYLIEGAGGVVAFFTLKRLKVLRFAIVPLIPAIGLFLAGNYNEFAFKNKISDQQYNLMRDSFNQFLAEEKPKVMIDGKEVVVTSLDDLQKSNNNANEIVEKQRIFEYFVIENGKKIGISKENAEKSGKIYIEANNTGYNIFYKKNRYKIENSFEIPESLNPDFLGLGQRKYNNHQLTETGIKFGSGADYFEISYKKIENAFKKGPGSDGNYILEEDSWANIDVILKKQ